MIKLVQEIRSPIRRTVDVPEIAITEQLKSFIIERMKMVELTMMDSIAAAMHRHDELNYDLKQFHKTMDLWEKAFSGFAARLVAIEGKLGIEPFEFEKLRPGDWKLTAQRKHRRSRLPGPEPEWKKEEKAAAEAAAKKLAAELPPKVSVPNLQRRFGVSRTRIDAMIREQKLKAIREGCHLYVTRESLVAYVREYNVPRPLFRHYGVTAEGST